MRILFTLFFILSFSLLAEEKKNNYDNYLRGTDFKDIYNFTVRIKSKKIIMSFGENHLVSGFFVVKNNGKMFIFQNTDGFFKLTYVKPFVYKLEKLKKINKDKSEVWEFVVDLIEEIPPEAYIDNSKEK